MTAMASIQAALDTTGFHRLSLVLLVRANSYGAQSAINHSGF